MKKLINKLKKHKKIVVTGPHRSGTTIAAFILATDLGYKFVDEQEYDGNDPEKFMKLFSKPRKMVIQNTSFMRDLHRFDFCIVLVKRKIKDILASYRNSEKFKKPYSLPEGMCVCLDKETQGIILNHYNKNGCLPEIAYSHFEKHTKDYYTLNYEDLKSHKLFIKREVRRNEFTHIKQITREKT